MHTATEKTTKPSTPVRQAGAQGTFFRKADEPSFFGAEQDRGQDSFFSPASVQAKLTVSQPDDPYEREADATAEQVMRMATPPAPGERKEEVQRQELRRSPDEKGKETIADAGPQVSRIEESEEVQPRLMRSALTSSAKTFTASPNVHSPPHSRGSPGPPAVQRNGRGPPSVTQHFESFLNVSKGGGSPMPAGVRTSMEARFGADFSGVRIHTGTWAESLSTSIRAEAFVHGSDIYFNKGKWSPGTASGDFLLAHELTHTIQQGASGPRASNPRPAGKKSFGPTLQPRCVQRSSGAAVQQHTVQRASSNIPIIQRLAADDFSDKAGGSALPEDARAFLEDYYQTSLADIRIHTDADAVRLCLQAGQPSLVQGAHICVLPAVYRPDTEDGAMLLSNQVSLSLTQRGKLAAGAATAALGGLFQQIGEAAKAAVSPEKKQQQASPAADDAVPIIEPKKAKGDAGDKAATGHAKKKAGAIRKAAKRGESVDAPMPPRAKAAKRSPRSPAEDPSFQRVVRATNKTAKAQQAHDPADKKATEAQRAAEAVPAEAESKAQDRKSTALGTAAQKDIAFDAKAFEQELREKIEAATPQTLEEANEFKENNRVGEVKAAVGQKVAEGKAETTGPVATEATTPMAVNPADAKQAQALPPTPAGPRPTIPGAKDAAPKKKTAEEISLEEQSSSLDADMAANGVTEDQLASAEEPSFGKALDEKKAAQADAAQAPLTYRKTEGGVLGEAKAEAQGDAAIALTGMHGARGKAVGGVVAGQQTARGRDEARRAEVVREIGKKFEAAKTKVDKAMEAADTEANSIFDSGAEAARTLFEDHVDLEMRRYKLKRYSGFWGGARWIKDKLFGMPDAVNRFYAEGREMYLRKMDTVIRAVALSVATNLGKAKQAIAEGKADIDAYVAQLPKDLKDVGKDAAEDISAKFEALEQAVTDKRESLKEGLAKKYVDNLKQLDSRIDELKAANQGLVDKVIGALKAIYRVIRDLTELFTTILARLASIISVVISNPSGFFKNVGAAFRAGLDAFISKFDTYLEEGLMAWLATNLGIAGLQLPKNFSLASIFGLVMQVIGFTPQKVEERAEAVLGARQVAALKSAGGILHRIYAEGPGALWDIVAEKLSDLREIVWDALKAFFQKRIVEEAIKMILMMLNPIGGLIKVCMMVYDFLMMLVRFKDRIIELLDTILSAVVNIANGAIDGAAKAIEAAFAKSIPVIIGFLAGLLRLNNIASAVRGIITRIQARVEKVLDFGLKKAAAFVAKGLALVKRGGTVVVEKGKAAAATVAGWLGFRQRFTTASGVPHTAYIRQRTGGAALIIESTPMDASQFFRQKEAEISASTTPATEKAARLGRISHGQNLLRGLQVLMNDEAQRANPRIPQMITEVISIIREADPGAPRAAPGRAIYTPGFSMGVIATSFSARFVHKGGIFTSRDGNPVTVPKNHAAGSEPSKTALPMAFRILAGMRLSDRWARFHIVNADFGGLGMDSNLIPTPKYINNPDYLTAVENPLKGYYDSGLPIWLRASVTYRPRFGGVFPLQYTANAGAMKYMNGQWAEDSARSVPMYSRTIDPPEVSSFNITEVLNDRELASILVNISSMSYGILDILRARIPAGGYRSVRQMERAIEDHVYGTLQREFTDFPQAIPQPTDKQRKEAERYKRNLNSADYTF